LGQTIFKVGWARKLNPEKFFGKNILFNVGWARELNPEECILGRTFF
jgi:hypothetical protein